MATFVRLGEPLELIIHNYDLDHFTKMNRGTKTPAHLQLFSPPRFSQDPHLAAVQVRCSLVGGAKLALIPIQTVLKNSIVTALKLQGR